MTTYTITTSNWDDPTFWSSISPTGNGHTFDFSGLPSNYYIDFVSDFSYIEITQTGGGSPTTYRIGDTNYSGGDEDTTLGGSTTLSQFSTFVSNDGTSTAFGTSGDETFTDGDDGAYFEGGGGSDTLDGGGGDDTLDGGTGDDSLDGDDDADTFVINDNFGNDTIVGGEGGTDDDTIDLSELTGSVTVTYSGDEAGTITDGNDTITFSEIENLILTDEADVVDASADSAGVNIYAGDGNDTLTGGTGSDTIRGEDGNDTIDGGAGNDSLLGGDGADSITAGAGTNYTDGGAGNDTLIASNFGSGVDTVEGGTGDDSIVGGNGRAVLSGGDGNDTITGGDDFASADIDTIDGGAGNDYLVSGQTSAPTAGTQANGDIMTGGSGHDTIIGGEADDGIDGGVGNDSIDGGGGDDQITGGGGDDTITTGTGWDRVFFSDGDGNDVITDFNLGDHDSDGFTNDQLDLAGLTDAEGNPVNVDDVVVSDDGSGNALLTFPNGETLVLQGVAPTQVDTGSELHSIGVACFVSGTLIATQHGEKPVQDLKVGDHIETLDDGLQPIEWIGSRHCSRDYLERHPHHAPIRFETNVIGNHSPLFVSTLHAILIGQGQGVPKNILVRAKHLAELPGPVRIARGKREVTYHHLLLPKHSVIFANGCPCESFYPGFEALRLYEAKQLASLINIIPHIATKSTKEAYGARAYPIMRRKDVLAKVRLRQAQKFSFKDCANLDQSLPVKIHP